MEHFADIKCYTDHLCSCFNGYIISWEKFSSLKMVQGKLFKSHLIYIRAEFAMEEGSRGRTPQVRHTLPDLTLNYGFQRVVVLIFREQTH